MGIVCLASYQHSQMKQYTLLNNIFGWVAFTIAATTYLLTIEPTASFWDCGEFITSGYKLEVGHPPGAPFFMLTANFFSHFASDPSQVAKMVNIMSALLSAATILFLFWTITHLAKKLIYTDKSKEITLGQTIIIIGSGLVGSLAYTYSDTFWFSAVEAEVYAYSSLFTALVFWLILKWEDKADHPSADKWIILIAYMVGLSIGVHLLNLLCIPAMILVYYFKKSPNATLKGTLLALLGSFALIVILLYGVIPGFTKVGGVFELLFVNTFGLPYNSGVFFYFALLICTIIWGIYQTMRKQKNIKLIKVSAILCLTLAGVPFIGGNIWIWAILFTIISAYIFSRKELSIRLVNTSILCLMVILVGYSAYAIIPIRSAANPPMDQNSPEDVFSLGKYLSREQYGDTPLFYGKTFASAVKRDAQGNPIEKSTKNNYDKIVKTSPGEKDKYFISSTSNDYEYTHEQFFPRMYSNEPRHLEGYKQWGGIENTNTPPTFMQNLQYFFSYQLNFMYWRYFMWNFSGRQNDIQNTGGLVNGNWITGIPFFDQYVLGLGPQDNLPPEIVENKGYNRYYMLPFLLGLVGIIFQLCRKKEGEQGFWIIFMLFFMTGIAIVIYLNQKPYEPRERDYAYAGSFYAFAIWIGLGVTGIYSLIKKKLSETPSAIIATLACLAVPTLMAFENWDDHDRSGRYTMRDFGMNYLRTCAPNAIIFTNGDNDTFPLWYAQDVEGFRQDVRVCNLSYLQTDWYIDQMRRQAYSSEPLPIKWDKSHYIGDRAAYAYIISKEMIDKAIDSQLQSYYNVQSQSNTSNIYLHNEIQTIGNREAYYDQSAYLDTVPLAPLMKNLRTHFNYAPKNPFGVDQGLIVTGSQLSLNVNTDQVNWASLNTQPSDKMVINLGDKNVLYRHELMILEMLSNINESNWDRPIYYAVTVGSDMYLNLKNNFQLEGLAYRITPSTQHASVNTEVMYDNLVNQFQWGGVENPKVYLDENNIRSCITYRYLFAQLVEALIKEGQDQKALTALNRCIEVLPPKSIPYGTESIALAEGFYALGETQQAEEILAAIVERTTRSLRWFNRLSSKQMQISMQDIWEKLLTLEQVAETYQNYNTDKYQSVKEQLIDYAPIYFLKGNTTIGNSLLQVLTQSSLESQYYQRFNSTDSAFAKIEEDLFMKILQLMQQHSPALLQRLQQTEESNHHIHQ